MHAEQRQRAPHLGLSVCERRARHAAANNDHIPDLQLTTQDLRLHAGIRARQMAGRCWHGVRVRWHALSAVYRLVRPLPAGNQAPLLSADLLRAFPR